MFSRNTDQYVLTSVPVQVSLVAEERDQNIGRVQELEAAVAELKITAGSRLSATLWLNRVMLVKPQSQLGAFSVVKVAILFPSALLSQEKEAQSTVEALSSGPSEGELALQEALNTLQQEKDHVHAQYQAQVNTRAPHRFIHAKIS